MLFFLPNWIALVFDSFTIIWLKQQNCIRPLSCLCKPVIESENKIRSSAQSKCPITFSPMHTPNSLVRYWLRSDIYFRNSIPLQIPPWFTPISLSIGELSNAICLHILNDHGIWIYLLHTNQSMHTAQMCPLCTGCIYEAFQYKKMRKWLISRRNRVQVCRLIFSCLCPNNRYVPWVWSNTGHHHLIFPCVPVDILSKTAILRNLFGEEWQKWNECVWTISTQIGNETAYQRSNWTTH